MRTWNEYRAGCKEPDSNNLLAWLSSLAHWICIYMLSFLMAECKGFRPNILKTKSFQGYIIRKILRASSGSRSHLRKEVYDLQFVQIEQRECTIASKKILQM